MIKRLIMMLLLVGAVLGGVVGFQRLKTKLIAKAVAGYEAAPKTVSAVTVDYQDWQGEITSVGTLKAARHVEVAAEVPGVVDHLGFESGARVDEGAVLAHLRPDEAEDMLAQFEATAGAAALADKRDQEQFNERVISQAAMDDEVARFKSAQAQVQAQMAVVDKKTIRAPFAGRMGIRRIDSGQWVNPGTVIATLDSLDPLEVEFSLPQHMLAAASLQQRVTVKVDTFPDRTFGGAIVAIDNVVDPATRSIRIRAALDATPVALLPGMYVTVTVPNGPPRRLLTLPQTSIAYNAFGNTVFVLEPNGKDAEGRPVLVAHLTFVKTDARRGDQVAVLSGIEAGATIVTAGQGKLGNGTAVVVDNTVQPSDRADATVRTE